MSSLSILDMPDECLLMVFKKLDIITQCSFGIACQRFQEIYEMIYKNHFRCFTWYQPTSKWTKDEIESFFKLNGHKMNMMSVSDIDDNLERPFLGKANQFINVCMHLKNLRSLILCVDKKLADIIIEICKHLHKLENLIISSGCHPNYEFLVVLPNLKSLDIDYFVNPKDKVFQRFAELRPDALQHLRIGSELTLQHGNYIGKLSGLTLLNIKNPCYHFFNSAVLQLANLRVLSITNVLQLREYDFRHLVMHLKFLATLYIIKCKNLTNELIIFIIQYLKGEVMQGINCRRLPFHLDLSETPVSDKINEMQQGFHLLKLVVN